MSDEDVCLHCGTRTAIRIVLGSRPDDWCCVRCYPFYKELLESTRAPREEQVDELKYMLGLEED